MLPLAVLVLSPLLTLGQSNLPDAPGRALVQEKCQSCHGLEPVVANKLSQSDWNNLVGQMISFGAAVSESERTTIVNYLATYFGTTPPPATPAQSTPPVVSGAAVYANCVGCHQANGTGVAGVFPPLANHVPELLKPAEGRTFLIQVMLYGLQGPITVAGQRYNGVMPGFANLTDAEIAAVLNHIATQWNNSTLLPANHQAFTPNEVRAQRERRLTPAQVLEIRGRLGL